MKKAKLLFGLLAMLMATLIIAGCGGGSSGTAESQDGSGELVVSLTDAPGDFASYTVDVLSLTLTKANGAEVSALPMQTRIDFSQYTDMTEFLTAATMPNGVYVAATMTLDYSNADIWVEDQTGNMVQVATILDSDGNPVTTLQATVRLENRNRLLVAPGVPAHLMLDFNLEATNRVNFGNAGQPAVSVDPLLVADVNRNGNKLHRLRGLLDEVSVDENSFSVFLRPFFCALDGSHSRYGSRTVTTTDATIYEINGEQYVGGQGLTAMAALTPLAAVVAIGDLKFNPLRFEAREVYAGSSVPGGDLDAVKGSVVQRQGDTLTVKGATLIRQDGTIIFNDQVTVEVGVDTIVSRQFSSDAFDTDDISVGQRVVFRGQLTNSDPLALTLDATQGYAHMLQTTVRGHVTGMDESDPVAQLTVDLQSINHRRVDEFDFTGTGVDASQDADPADYQINTGTLDLGFLAADDPVKVRGFVQPFGQAPADFNARTIISVADVRAIMKVQWTPPSGDAFDSVSNDGLVLNLEGTGGFHHVVRGWVVTDLTASSPAPMLIPRADGTGLFVLRSHGIVQVVLTFDEFIEALQDSLQGGGVVNKLGAVGEFDDAVNVFTADIIELQLN